MAYVVAMHVTVLGAGSWGTTVASLVSSRNPTMLWARNPDVAAEVNAEHRNESYLPGFDLAPKLTATSELEEAASFAELLIVGVPTTAVRSTLEQAAPWIHPWIPIVSLAKGLEQKTLLRMTEVIADVAPGRPVAALTGPNIAREIMAGQAAAAVIATEDLSVARAIQDVLTRGLFRVYLNDDVIGCELGGSLKNVVAIASGIAQGLGVGDNTRSAVMTRGLAELTRLGVAMGGRASTFAGLAGMGDLITTCISPHSRNRHVGEQLGAGWKLADILAEMNMVAEGVKTATTARELARRHDVPMPVCDEIYKVVSGKASADRAYRGLHLRPGHEKDPG
ncbi:NAD(P)H-dependent glycerol-3-phosphate dehydrogenase [soil metagenome]